MSFTYPKSTVSVASSAGTTIGTVLQTVHSGALMPATACTPMAVLRDEPPGSRLQKSSGASAVTTTCTAVAVLQSPAVPMPLVALAAVSKQLGCATVLVRLPEPTPTWIAPKL